MKKNHYQILGVEENASTEEIKTAFRRLARQHHPDLHGGNKAKEALFKEITAANEELSSPERRAKYDRLRAQQAHRPPAPPTPPRAATPPPAPVSPPSAGGAAAAGLGLFALGLGVLAAWAAAQNSRSEYDPSVDRYRGADGRFKRT